MPNIVIPDEAKRLLVRLGAKLQRRQVLHRKLNEYRDGRSPIPLAVQNARVTRSYRMLMPMADAPWGDLVVGSTMDRLEITGIRDPDSKEAADECWDLWQRNSMDLESKVANDSILTDGRANALCWREPGSDYPTVTLDNMSTMIVEYAEGSRTVRTAAMRYWVDDEDRRSYATIYTPKYLYKFIGPKNSTGISGVRWEAREAVLANGEPEAWPLPNPYGVVPAVEVGINRKLRPGRFPFARGEFEHCTGLIDRINLLTFLGLVVAFWMGFPLRGVIGERVIKDDDGKAIPPFDAQASGMFQLENKDAKLAEFKAADRGNLSVLDELAQLAMITKTPRHYFPMQGGMANLAADAIRASEGALHAKVSNYKPSMGEGWEEVARLLGSMSDNEVELGPNAQVIWKDTESRSLAERADAASKLKDVMPQIGIAEMALDVPMDTWRRWQSEAATNAIANVVAAATAPAPPGAVTQTPGGVYVPAGAAPAPTNGGPVGQPGG